jgi:predicted  nucleic acid-binding Zn-ribbon protein
MQGSSWAAVIFAILGFAAAAGFGALYFVTHKNVEEARRLASTEQTKLDDEIKDMKEKNVRLDRELRAKLDEVDRQKKQMNELNYTIKQEEARSKALDQEIRRLKGQIKDFEAGSDAIVKKLREDVDKRNNRIEGLSEDLRKANSSLTQAQLNLSAAKTDLQRLEKENERLLKQMDNARQQADSASVDKAAKEVLKAQLRDREQQIQDLKDKLDKIEKSIAEKDDKIRALSDTVAKSGQATEELGKANEALRQRERELGTKEAEVKALEGKVGKLEEQARLDKTEIDSLRKAVEAKGDAAQQVKSLNDAIAGMDQTIRKKDDEITELEKKLLKAQEGAKETAKTGEAEATKIQEQLANKSTEVTKLQKDVQVLREENASLNSLLKSEKRTAKLVSEGEEREQVKLRAIFWRTNSSMSVRNTSLDPTSTTLVQGHNIDLEKDLGLDMQQGSLTVEAAFSARFGFALAYQEMTFSGRSIMATNKNFYGYTFEAGNTVESEFYVQQGGIGLVANLGALHKSDSSRIDLNGLLGGRYFKLNARMLDVNDGDRATDTHDAPILYAGLRVSAIYRDGLTWSIQGQALSFEFGEHYLRNHIELKVAFGFVIMEALAIEFGYAYSDTHLKYEDDESGEKFITKINSEGPFVSLVLTF